MSDRENRSNFMPVWENSWYFCLSVIVWEHGILIVCGNERHCLGLSLGMQAFVCLFGKTDVFSCLSGRIHGIFVICMSLSVCENTWHFHCF